MNDSRYRLTFKVEQEQLFRDALAMWDISKRALTAIKFQGGQLLVNDAEQNVRHMLQVNDLVTIIFPPEEISDGLVPVSEKLNIIFEDHELLVIAKQPYQNTIPSHDHPTRSVANFVVAHFQQQDLASTVHVVTRLDRDTSGLMCIAKHRHIHHLMSEAQKRHDIHRTYEAIVHGHMELHQQEIIAPIGRKEGSIIERVVRDDGQFAHTDVYVLKRTTIQGEAITHIRLKLHTGRTHQIRVHMASIGHPLVGDTLYGGNRVLINRQALHCVELQLHHPITKQYYSWQIALPKDMQSLLIEQMS
ncbi:RluA family pseudouridine synthase [Viridibacillus sp. YIM B01967]|uniref:RNA pseudouridylate synthase n=1 Tax=Viridibacillus soli TaxID=2798301 RepID=A0ABS1H6H6_9BACL|nr:RluA family pseudouridine synthase [Viridibacillus soli]MBK3494909.1 RluA family pseudouridine synthase [Viridibacillus soli]